MQGPRAFMAVLITFLLVLFGVQMNRTFENALPKKMMPIPPCHPNIGIVMVG